MCCVNYKLKEQNYQKYVNNSEKKAFFNIYQDNCQNVNEIPIPKVVMFS